MRGGGGGGGVTPIYLEGLRTPKRYQDPVLWAWFEMFLSPLRGTNFYTVNFIWEFPPFGRLSSLDGDVCPVTPALSKYFVEAGWSITEVAGSNYRGQS